MPEAVKMVKKKLQIKKVIKELNVNDFIVYFD